MRFSTGVPLLISSKRETIFRDTHAALLRSDVDWFCRSAELFQGSDHWKLYSAWSSEFCLSEFDRSVPTHPHQCLVWNELDVHLLRCRPTSNHLAHRFLREMGFRYLHSPFTSWIFFGWNPVKACAKWSFLLHLLQIVPLARYFSRLCRMHKVCRFQVTPNQNAVLLPSLRLLNCFCQG